MYDSAQMLTLNETTTGDNYYLQPQTSTVTSDGVRNAYLKFFDNQPGSGNNPTGTPGLQTYGQTFQMLSEESDTINVQPIFP